MISRVSVLALLAAEIVLAPAPLSGDQPGSDSPNDWPQWRGPNRDGISTETNWRTDWPPDGPAVVWRKTIGTGYSAISLSKGLAYTQGRANGNDFIYCLDAASGKEMWKYAYPIGKFQQLPAGDVGPASTPTVSGGSVYVLGLDGDLFCLAAGSGTILWRRNVVKEFEVKPPPYGFASSPLVKGNKLIVDVGRTIALDRSDGSVIWKSEDYGASYASPVLLDHQNQPCLAGFNALGLVILHADDGAEVFRQAWSFRGINNVNSSTPIAWQNKIFIASAYESGWGLIELDSGRNPPIVWRKQHEWHLFSTPILLEGYLYGFNAATLQCVDFNSGDVMWSKAGLGKGSLISANGLLLILSEQGELVVAEASSSRDKEIARAQVLGAHCWTAPVLSRGRLYCRNSKGAVVCLNLR